MPQFRLTEAAKILGVSDDTLRRWVNAGLVPVVRDSAGRKVIDGTTLAAVVRDRAHPIQPVTDSTGNRFVGVVTEVIAGAVMTQIKVQCGPYCLVSLISTEASQELDLVAGSVVAAMVSPTHVMLVDIPRNPREGTVDRRMRSSRRSLSRANRPHRVAD